MLSKEKKLAESVHEELKKAASRSDVDMMVGLGSGSSEDWKLILKASYEGSGSGVLKLFRAITDLQYHHMMFDEPLATAMAIKATLLAWRRQDHDARYVAALERHR